MTMVLVAAFVAGVWVVTESFVEASAESTSARADADTSATATADVRPDEVTAVVAARGENGLAWDDEVDGVTLDFPPAPQSTPVKAGTSGAANGSASGGGAAAGSGLGSCPGDPDVIPPCPGGYDGALYTAEEYQAFLDRIGWTEDSGEPRPRYTGQ